MPRIGAIVVACILAAGGCATPATAPPPDRAFVFLRPAQAELTEERARELGQGHMANIRRLAAEGALLFAGPTGDGGGIFILRAATMEEAAQLIATDPAVAAGAFEPDTFLAVTANGSLCSPWEPIQMMRRDLVGGRWPAPGAEARFRRGAGLASADLLLVDREHGRFVMIFDGAAAPERRVRLQRLAADTGVVLEDVAEVFSARGLLCDTAE